MSHFERGLNKNGDGLPRRLQMFPFLLIGCVIGRDNYLSSSIIINYQLSWGYNLGLELIVNDVETWDVLSRPVYDAPDKITFETGQVLNRLRADSNPYQSDS